MTRQMALVGFMQAGNVTVTDNSIVTFNGLFSAPTSIFTLTGSTMPMTRRICSTSSGGSGTGRKRRELPA